MSGIFFFSNYLFAWAMSTLWMIHIFVAPSENSPWNVLNSALGGIILVLVGFLYKDYQKRQSTTEESIIALQRTCGDLKAISVMITGGANPSYGISNEVSYLKKRERELTMEIMKLRLIIMKDQKEDEATDKPPHNKEERQRG